MSKENKIVGDVNGISETQLNFVLNTLSKYSNRDPVIFEDVGKKGDNFLATVKRITKDVDEDKQIKAVAKFAPTIPSVREVIDTVIAFKNESVIYDVVFPKFQELQKRFMVPEEYTLEFAKCYGILSEAPHEVIILEDLHERDYVVLNKFQTLNHNTIKVILKTLAVYHSLSYAFKRYDVETFENVKGTLKSLFDKENKPKQTQPDELIALGKLISSLVNTGERKDHLLKVFEVSEEYGRKMYEQDLDAPNSIIQHGDAWTNNFLFKLQNDEPESCILIDFQGARVGSTAIDLLFMLLSCSDHKSRIEHFHEWMDYYYSELDNCLRHYGMSANKELPREVFDNDLRRYCKVSLITAMIITFFTNRESSEVVDIKMDGVSIDDALKSMDTGMSEATLNKLRVKYQGMYDTCVHFNLLD